MKFFHWIKHLLGWNTGTAACFSRNELKNGKLISVTYMGYWCDGCDIISGVHEINIDQLL